jgi:hypothetical protein
LEQIATRIAKATKRSWKDVNRELLEDPDTFVTKYRRHLKREEIELLVGPSV